MGGDQSGERVSVREVLGTSARLLRKHPLLVGLAVFGAGVSLIPYVGSLITAVIGAGLCDLIARRAGLRHREAVLPFRLWGWFGASIIAGIVIMLGLVLLIIPGLYVGVMYSLYVPAAMVGSNGPIDALKASTSRVRGNVPTVASLNLVLVAPALAVIFGIAIFTRSAVLLLAIGVPIGGVGFAMITAAHVVLYHRLEPADSSSRGSTSTRDPSASVSI